jgi:GT2 family glycosyltransferase/DNA-binding beta-propeller fold protein YncE
MEKGILIAEVSTSANVTIAVQTNTQIQQDRPLGAGVRVVTDGKFLRAGDERFLLKGVTYGTFAPEADGYQFPNLRQVSEDFRLMADLGINTVRTYTPPRLDLLDEAARHGLRVMVGLPWSQHVAFLDNRTLKRTIRKETVSKVRELSAHPAVGLLALGNEIPPGVVRWHGRVRIERFLHALYEDAKSAAPENLLTYVNFPPTEFLDLSFFDLYAFNLYLHRESELRAYLARLQHLAGHKPLLLAEAGACSKHEGEAGQAAITAMHIRAAFEEGAAGAIAFAWTDEWWRGGYSVDDWAFGLVDQNRQPKPAALAVSQAFAAAPFPGSARSTWPRVSVVVCAYNASDTLEECLTSLENLTYPDYEIILVNDGSRDSTSEIGHRHSRVRVIDIPNGGLSAARNVGIAEARGDIVAYTDADVHVDRDWLTYLVQPFLTSDVVGCGGPNVVPPNDPPMAQCIARAPGGPTHVLLDDRIAEHVPGCNMAFRRNALLAIGGFNPTFLRAGDDVDICWRLQARGWKIGFSSSALVWHHHRSSVSAYWRQQVGYGEGETWLMGQHPEKFLDGRMLWHGRIYSPLPFVRSLWGTRINAGPWGMAAFPSVYRTDVHPFAFLPHSIRWQVFSFILALFGLGVAATRQHKWAALLLLGAGLVGIAVTIAKNVTYAMRSDVHSLTGSRFLYRVAVAYLHFIQPLARVRGRIRGALSPPAVALPRGQRQTSRGPRPSLGEAWRALLLISGTVAEDRFWSETWTSTERVLDQLTNWLRRSPAVRTIDVDDGWSDDRDVSVFVGRWAWLDIRALVEDHGGGKGLLRVSSHLRPTTFGVVAAIGFGAAVLVAAFAGVAWRWPLAGAVTAGFTLAIIAVIAWRTAQTTALVRRAISRVALGQNMIAMRSGPARVPLLAPSLFRTYGLRSALIFVVMVVGIGTGTFMLREAAGVALVIGGRTGSGANGPTISAWLDTPGGLAIANDGDLYFADSNNHVIDLFDRRAAVSTVVGNGKSGFSGDDGLAIKAQLDTPDGVALAPDGDLIVADSHNDRIRRVDRATRIITTIAGSGETGYDGDDKSAIEAALNTPNAVWATPNGDIYIADTFNNRVRMIDHATGFIQTVAGDGEPGGNGPLGDGGPASSAHLFMPSDIAVARNGDLYIADMHHNRIRKVDAKTKIITTVAGNGVFGQSGDDGPATEASLAGPAGIALIEEPPGTVNTIYIADYYNGTVRAVSRDGLMRNVSDEGRVVFGAPSRVAFDPRRGYLYVADSSNNRIVAMDIQRMSAKARLVPRSLPALPGRRTS